MFSGIYTPVVTPFKESEEIDFDKMGYNLDRWGNTELDGIVVLGSNGEFVYQSAEEKLELIKFVASNFNKQKKIIAGTSCESTRDTIILSKKASDLGVDAVLVLPPHYYKGAMKEDILYSYYTDVADGSPVPVMIYNMPLNTGINIPASLISTLSKHPNIVGVKDTSGNIVQLSEIVRDTDENFAVFAGNAGYLLAGLAVGVKGATVALGNILPEDCCRLLSLFRDGEIKEALAIQQKMLEINQLVTGRYGVPGLKAAMDMLRFKGGFPRRPLKPVPDEGRKVIMDALIKYGALRL